MQISTPLDLAEGNRFPIDYTYRAMKAKMVMQPIKAQKPETVTDATVASPVLGRLTSKKRANGEKNEEKEEERPILEIREQASEIEKSVLAFCMDPNKKVNKEQTTTIMRHFKDMRNLLGELLLYNGFLTEKLEHGSDETKNQGCAIYCAQWASRCKPANDVRQLLTCKVAQTAVKLPKDVVIIWPEAEDGEIKTSEKARDAVFTLVNS